MKYQVLVFILSLSIGTVFAKKVKFVVDMTGKTISANGVHVTGDFQTIAGFPGGDFNAATTELTKQGSTELYSIVVDIPAFKKYEYKFVNGDQFYDAEFVPVESRVGYSFNDNRWIYVDSINTDTFSTGAILFGGNAPSGLSLLRVIVNVANANVSGIHVAGNFNNWDYASHILYNLNPDTTSVYERILFVTASNIEYKFSNGNNAAAAEVVPVACATNGNRSVTVASDIVKDGVCFSSCTACGVSMGVKEVNTIYNIAVWPNPVVNGNVIVKLQSGNYTILVYDISGRVVRSLSSTGETNIEVNDLVSGIYTIQVRDALNEKISNTKLIVGQ